MNGVRLEDRAGVCVVTIDQPGRRANVLNAELWADLHAALDAAAGAAGVVLASGKPGTFVAGADLAFFLSPGAETAEGVRAFLKPGLRLLARLEALEAPTAAAIDGPALGGGLELALACDARLAGTHERMELGLPEVKLGLIPGWGGTQRLPRLIGGAPALGMLMSGESVRGASVAGLVAEVVPSADLVDRAVEVVLGLAASGVWRSGRAERRGPVAGPPPAVAGESAALVALGEVVAEGWGQGLAGGVEVETGVFCRLASSAGARAGVAGFFAARGR